MELIKINNLSKCYDERSKNKIYAVKNVDLIIKKGEAMGLVGESGCGKSTLGKLILQLEKNSHGEVLYKGIDISKYNYNQMRKIRNNLQMVFQNSSNTFNPYFTVKQIIMEPISDNDESKEKKDAQCEKIFEKLGLNKSFLNRYGNELSGGQRQRVGIARALITNPEFVICDEAVSSLDHVIKKQILKLLLELKSQMGLTYLFISHDLKTIENACDRIVVMYMGNIMEIIPDIHMEKEHPYTKALFAASLIADPRKREKKKVLFKENAPKEVPKCGCIFQNRCLYTKDICKKEKPNLLDIGKGHMVACHLNH